MGFEPMRGISPPKRLAGARTRPLCDPSTNADIIKTNIFGASLRFVKSDTIKNAEGCYRNIFVEIRLYHAINASGSVDAIFRR